LERPVALFIPIVVLAGTSLLAWVAYLIFLRFLVNKTNDAASLKHAAVAARAFPHILGKLLFPRGR
jgi:hypothetical protein